MLKRLKIKIKNILQQIINDSKNWEDVQLILSGKTIMMSDDWQSSTPLKLCEKEFKVYSQFGDDGIIQFLIKTLSIESKSFIEFGVGDYFESNTHFLLVNNNWKGFVIDGSDENIATIKNSPIYWRYNLVAISEFIITENINELLNQSGFKKIGLLHIDLDGNDYWILDKLDLTVFQPDILILEYNAHFGSDRFITIPYKPTFDRMDAHYSGQYFGASLPSLYNLASEKGYYFIGCNSAGNNAYFLRKEYENTIKPVNLQEGFVDAEFRDSRDNEGNLNFLSRNESLKQIRGLPVYNTTTKKMEVF